MSEPETTPDPFTDDEWLHAALTVIRHQFGKPTPESELSLHLSKIKHLPLSILHDCIAVQKLSTSWELDLDFDALVTRTPFAGYRARLLLKLCEIDPYMSEPSWFMPVFRRTETEGLTADDVTDHRLAYIALEMLVGDPVQPTSPSQPLLEVTDELLAYTVANISRLNEIITIIKTRRIFDPKVLHEMYLDGSALREGAL